MNFLKRWMPFLFGLIVIYSLGYFYEYDFGLGLRTNSFLTELGHFVAFVIFGFVACYSFCTGGKIKRPHAIYVFGIIFFISIIGVFNEVRVHPEHDDVANARDILFHLSAGTLGLIIWRLYKMESDNIV